MGARPRRLSPHEAVGLRTGFRHQLRQIYRGPDLIVLGLGVMIGAGIFSLAAQQAGDAAGPGVILSFAIAGFVCLLVAFCYAELSSALPASGSAFSFSYVIFGEFWAWLVGWALILEMALGAAAVARVWSITATGMLNDFGIGITGFLADYVGQEQGPDIFVIGILLLLTLIVSQGARLGLRALWIMVSVKVLAIVLLVIIGARHIDPANYQPFIAQYIPSSDSGSTLLHTFIGGSGGTFGWTGVFAAATVIVFAYIGFDLVATSAEEAEEGRRTAPRGIIGSLIIATILYLAVAVIMVGMVSFTDLGEGTSLATAFQSVGEPRMGLVISVAALIGLTTVMTVLLVALTRVLFSVARSGLLPSGLAQLSQHYKTPSMATWVIGLTIIAVNMVVPVLPLFDMVVLGALATWVFVAAGVIVARVTHPDLPRGFRIPMGPVVPMVTIAVTLWLMVNLEVSIWIYFCIWMAAGILIYLLYGRRHSAFARGGDDGSRGFDDTAVTGPAGQPVGPHQYGATGPLPSPHEYPGQQQPPPYDQGYGRPPPQPSHDPSWQPRPPYDPGTGQPYDPRQRPPHDPGSQEYGPGYGQTGPIPESDFGRAYRYRGRRRAD